MLYKDVAEGEAGEAGEEGEEKAGAGCEERALMRDETPALGNPSAGRGPDVE